MRPLHPLPSPRGRTAPAVLLALALSFTLSFATACTAPTPTASPPAPAAEPARPARPAPPADPPAQDDPAACAHGSCEIRVDGPVTIPLTADSGVTEIRVLTVDAGRVELVAVVPGGRVSTRCSGACTGTRTTTADGSSSVRLTAGAGAEIAVNDLRFDVREASGGAAVLHVTSG
ncbi:hypothetical protein LWC35_13595 [Pseudonocardia kujensis]|uniref:hypothetical protein n=1 Tax=Pseudonocardia kujensis TaxID=1128675 RepID=UPI001E407177|nr:hypothetical protein [Pseudonocardia kujensis]MCE0763936.1 hypothetical protein [Pseudonocardia kujensis]